MANEEFQILQFTPFGSFVNPTFWYKLAEIKIDVDKLNDAPKEISGYYTNYEAKNCYIEVDCTSFNKDFKPPRNCFTMHGILYNKNTIEDFKSCDKTSLINLEGEKLIDDIISGRAIDNPALLSRFFILSFADLKVYKFYYWFAFPSILSPIAFISTKNKTGIKLRDLPDIKENVIKLYSSLNDEKMQAYFILKVIEEDDWKYHSLSDMIKADCKENNFKNENLDKIYFCFSDPCEFENPSWLLRIYVTLLYLQCPLLHEKTVQMIGIRKSQQNEFNNSILWKVKVVPPSEDIRSKFIGWELNTDKKMLPRISSMGESMDPLKIAENSINLNLKLMKWRLLPDLNLEMISKTKCLLFGAGTLGCGVARNLLAWGFKMITFLDNGKVSFSNPVRQTLYRYEDALAKNKMKATTAVERIKEINPNVIAHGYVMQIPMPGHPVGESQHETIKNDLEVIEKLVQEHDVLFLLTDSRESRWLPTLLGAFHKKIIINAALGFDSYLVMRHGSNNIPSEERNVENVGNLKCIPGEKLGCYFCNDITAPGDSMKDRTLDQQCTVTRPGVSNIAASYAVELLVALLHHDRKDAASAYYSIAGDGKVQDSIPEDSLGIIPHSIRGFLSNYENILPATTKFPNCIACSTKVLEEYGKRSENFLFDVFDSTKYLEDVSGISELTKLENEAIECLSDIDISD